MFQGLRKDPNKEIQFGEFLELMDTLDLKACTRHALAHYAAG